MATGTLPKRDAIEFAPNVPVRIPGLKYPDGKIISNQYGERMMYSTSDGKVMFLDLDVGAKINLLELQRNEPFWVRKSASGKKHDLLRWDVWKDDGPRYEPTDDAWPSEPPSDLEVQLRDSIHQVQARQVLAPAPAPVGSQKNGASAPEPPLTPPAPVTAASPAPSASGNSHPNPHVLVTDGRPRTRLEDALKTVVAAVHATNEYAKSIGYAMPQFTSEDLRTMANTILIGGRQ